MPDPFLPTVLQEAQHDLEGVLGLVDLRVLRRRRDVGHFLLLFVVSVHERLVSVVVGGGVLRGAYELQPYPMGDDGEEEVLEQNGPVTWKINGNVGQL